MQYAHKREIYLRPKSKMGRELQSKQWLSRTHCHIDAFREQRATKRDSINACLGTSGWTPLLHRIEKAYLCTMHLNVGSNICQYVFNLSSQMEPFTPKAKFSYFKTSSAQTSIFRPQNVGSHSLLMA